MTRWLRALFWLALNPFIYWPPNWRGPWICPNCDLVAPSLWTVIRHVMVAEERDRLVRQSEHERTGRC